MSWYSLFKFSQSDFNYGAWISPSGEIIKVGDYGHRKYGITILKDRHNIEYDDNDATGTIHSALFNLGYVRLVYIGFNVQFDTMTDSQKSKLGAIIQRSQSASFTFESLNDRKKNAYCQNKIEAMRALRAI